MAVRCQVFGQRRLERDAAMVGGHGDAEGFGHARILTGLSAVGTKADHATHVAIGGSPSGPRPGPPATISTAGDPGRAPEQEEHAMAVDPRTPVIIGVGQFLNRVDQGSDPLEPTTLMVQAHP